MSDLIETINQLKNKYSPLEMSRDEYLALCVKQRLEERARKYEDEFKSFLEVLERDYISETKISKLTKSLKLYSQTSAIIYKGLLEQLRQYQKNLL